MAFPGYLDKLNQKLLDLSDSFPEKLKQNSLKKDQDSIYFDWTQSFKILVKLFDP